MTKKKQSRRTKSVSVGSILLTVLIAVGLLVLDQLGVIDLGLLGDGTTPVAEKPTPVVEKPGQAWYQVYFTSPRYPDKEEYHVGGLDERLAAAIDGAQKSVDVAAYELDLTSVADALIAAHKRGVQVRLVTDTDNVDEQAVRNVKKAGIPVVEDDRGAIMHNKFVVIDGAAVWTGSWNLTENGTYRNNNNAVALQSAYLAENYTAEFEEMFKDHAFGPTSPANTPHPQLTIGGVEVENYFAPEDEVADKLIPLLEGAQSSVRFMAFSFTHDGIAQAMSDRAKSGVAVQGVFEERGSDTEYSEYDKLKKVKGVEVRLDGNPYVMHHKVIVIDDEIVVLGSYNFSASADEQNDENVLVVYSADLAAHYLAEFQRVWAQAE
jgi:phosphatidylserine/phosphatidylglycerophosphate/cardiolipin synthase-like enzyme